MSSSFIYKHRDIRRAVQVSCIVMNRPANQHRTQLRGVVYQMEVKLRFSRRRQPCASRMPRLLPRLIKGIEKHSGQVQHFPLRRTKNRRKSLYSPPLLSPSFHPSHYERSILLADQNPVANAKAYARHKRLPPIMTRPRQTVEEAEDMQRQMTDKEFGWWSNPYRTLAFFLHSL
jgi:hypothetical protein